MLGNRPSIDILVELAEIRFRARATWSSFFLQNLKTNVHALELEDIQTEAQEQHQDSGETSQEKKDDQGIED